MKPDALRALVHHAWPGNVRELENETKRLLALEKSVIELEDLSTDVQRAASFAPPRDGEPVPTLDDAERRLIVAALKAAGGNELRAAEILGIPRGTLWHKMKRHGIPD